ncbi:hypothetical protein Tsubulata_042678 [Turnera subulata]|uniref:DUF4283 domain-containing protein n=1 Tax=Turnera subulata TaxID=218843 RepID=A0A9Q0J0E3_9ROSI|nr:hypothetical protein Tsubulata_042678 [Turnera subulata]
MASVLYDSSGLACERSSVVLDLGKLSLPSPSLMNASLPKGNSVSATLPAPVDFVPLVSNSKNPSPSTAPEVLADTSSSAHLPLKATGPALKSTSVIPPVKNDASATWANVVPSTPSIPQPLKFVAPLIDADSTVITIPPALIDVGRKKYSLCLVGQFMGNAPTLGLIHAMANKLWGRSGAISASTYRDGLFLFQFPDDFAYSRALYRGPWHVGGVPALELFNQEIRLIYFSLSYQDCSRLFRGDTANVRIEIDFSKPLQNELTIDIHGERVVIAISYSWKPQYCDNCKNWGHHILACPIKKIVAEWVPKAKSSVAAPPAVSNAAPIIIDTTVPDPELPISPAIESITECSKTTLVSSPKPLPSPMFQADFPTAMPSAVAINSAVDLSTVSSNLHTAHSPKKTRAASAGVGKLVQQISKETKAKRGQGNKNKSTQVPISVSPQGNTVPLVLPS